MIKKIGFFVLSIMLWAGAAFCADYTTTHYKLIVPEEGSRDWNAKISRDIITMDSVIYMLSQDSTNRVSRDGIVGNFTVEGTVGLESTTSTTTLGGQTGRLAIVSADGVTTCYIPIYAGS